MLVKQIEKDTNRILDWFMGDDIEYAREHGYEERECEQAYNGSWYLKGYAPVKPEPTLEETLVELEAKYNMPRVIREGILANPNMYSAFNVGKAKDLEDIAEQIRKSKEGK